MRVVNCGLKGDREGDVGVVVSYIKVLIKVHEKLLQKDDLPLHDLLLFFGIMVPFSITHDWWYVWFVIFLLILRVNLNFATSLSDFVIHAN